MISPLCASVFSSVKQFIIVATARAIRHLTQVDMKKALTTTPGTQLVVNKC